MCGTKPCHRRAVPALQVLKLDAQMLDLAEELKTEQSLLVFGRGYNYATALEAALKVRFTIGVGAGQPAPIICGHGCMNHKLALLDHSTALYCIEQHSTLRCRGIALSSKYLPCFRGCQRCSLTCKALLVDEECVRGSQVKEVALMHSEGLLAGEMKHGPLALVDEHLPLIVIATRDRMYAKMLSVVQQLLARGARLIILCDAGDAEIRATCASRNCRLIEVCLPGWLLIGPAPACHAVSAGVYAQQGMWARWA